MQYATPILFLIFNRPEETFRVFERIREIQPSNLFIAADGPRANKAGEEELCVQTRSVLQMIDWPCNIKTLFRDKNLGCAKGVSTAITWFFEQVESGIILEDDCYPDISFFQFCEEMLELYKNDTRVGQISGNNFNINTNNPYSYFFTKYVSIWGWATWRRAWNHYDLHMHLYKQEPQLVEDLLSNSFCVEEKQLRSQVFNNTANGKIDTWDHQWFFCCLMNNMLTIIPTTNLISNIGFGKNATHTTQNEICYANLQTASILFPLKHPDFINRSEGYESELNKEKRKKPISTSMSIRIKQKFKKWL